MNKLPKEKRDRLILVCVGTLIVLSLIGFGMIRPEYDAISATNKQIDAKRNQLVSMGDAINMAENLSAQLVDLSYTLDHAQNDLAYGDPNSWIYDTIRNFKGKYKVDISVNGQLTPGDVDLLPKFQYKQIKATVSGTAYYHDLGKFIADFENTYPHARIANLVLEPGGAGGANEKLSFRMDIITLVKPTGQQG